jgi:hypothetical protein
MIRLNRYWRAAIVLLAAFGSARADTFYVVVFGADSKPQRPKFSHSWATFVRLPGDCGCGPPADPKPLESITISWMPCKIELTPHRPLSEPGTNLDLQASFAAAYAHCEHVGAYGPLQIDECLFCRAKQHLNELESGAIRYKTIDAGHPFLNACNCIHALTAFESGQPRVRVGRTNFGEVASYFVTESYLPHIIDPSQVHCWIADVLGLGLYPIKWRTLGDGRPHPRFEN